VLFGKPSKRPKHPNRMNDGDAEWVLRRDGECVIAKLARWGWLVPREPCPTDTMTGRQTIEHTLRLGGRRVHDVRHMVRMCWHHNVNGEASRSREQVRRYLDQIHPGSIAGAE
jgi:hypothetical protein